MNPWTIIGWAIILLVAFSVLFKVIIPVLTIFYRVARSRDIQPAKGQVWSNALNKRCIEIVHAEADRIWVHSYSRGNKNRSYASFSVMPENWKTFLYNNFLYINPKDAQ